MSMPDGLEAPRAVPPLRANTPIDSALERGVVALRDTQRGDGFWSHRALPDAAGQARHAANELLLRRIVQRHDPDRERALVARLLAHQGEDGAFGDPSGSVLAYQALKLAGQDGEVPSLVRARTAIRAAGGIVACDLSARRWLATLGEFPWAGVPTVPIEAILLPPWAPLALDRLAAAAQPMVVARLLLSAHRWSAHLSPEQGLHELWLGPPTAAAVAYENAAAPGTWRHLFVAGDRAARGIGYTPLVGLHRRAIARAIEWLLQRQLPDGTWAGDARTTLDVLLALNAIGYTVDHPVVARAFGALDAFAPDGPCPDPIWQTGHVLAALRAADVAADDHAVATAMSALLEATATGAADGWAPTLGGTPCVETTAILTPCLTAGDSPSDHAHPAIRRAVGWATGRQSWNGGYAQTGVNQTTSLWLETPLAEELPLIDPPTPLATGRVLTAMAAAGFDRCLGRAWRAIEYLRATCDRERAWGGCVLQTAVAIDGLAAIGEPLAAPPFADAVAWLRGRQDDSGGFAGGPAASPVVATAAAVATLVRIAGADDPAVQRGVEWLLRTQRADGTWAGSLLRAGLDFTILGTALPVLALGRYRRGQGGT
jgi:squalene-hopene/tetraprenyl-beta-curcumene cyclase